MMKPMLVLPLLASFGIAGPIITVNNAANLASTLLGSGVTLVGTPTLTGVSAQAGTFSGGQTNLIGFSNGIVLSSGNVASATGSYSGPNMPTTIEGGAGSPLLSSLVGGATTYDAALLQFSFVPNASTVFFQYSFASAEYPVYVNLPFNDVFGFFVNGVNYALLPGTSTPVSINTVNAVTNSQYFNKYNAAGDTLPYGGETKVLSFTAPVMANQVNTLTLGIADTSDALFDSAVFIQAGTLSTTSTTPEPGTYALLVSGLIGGLVLRLRKSFKKA